MTVTIIPFTVNSSRRCKAPSVVCEEEHPMLVTYWGIYLDDKHISHVSSKELAEKTKLWIEKWLKDRL